MDDPRHLEVLLGGRPRWTAAELAERAGVPEELARTLWRALGFPQTGPGQAAFTDADLAALQAVRSLLASSGIGVGEAVALARAMGRAMAMLAAGQVEALVAAYGLEGTLDRSDVVLPALQDLVVHAWRRHLFAAAERMAAAPDPAAAALVVGFVDIVGYTRRSRDLSPAELAGLLDGFDATVSRSVVEHRGRVVKTIGDEAMWVCPDPPAAALTALELVEALRDPPVRVGAAFGTTLASLGDHFGPVVNIAARLTALARPGTVLVDRALAAELAADPRFTLTELRPHPVRGYPHLLPVALRRA